MSTLHMAPLSRILAVAHLESTLAFTGHCRRAAEKKSMLGLLPSGAALRIVTFPAMTPCPGCRKSCCDPCPGRILLTWLQFSECHHSGSLGRTALGRHHSQYSHLLPGMAGVFGLFASLLSTPCRQSCYMLASRNILRDGCHMEPYGRYVVEVWMGIQQFHLMNPHLPEQPFYKCLRQERQT